MLLHDFLFTTPVSTGGIAIVSDSDNEVGYANYREGKYFFVENWNWVENGADWALAQIKKNEQALLIDFLDREIREIRPETNYDVVAEKLLPFRTGDKKEISSCLVVVVDGNAEDNKYWRKHKEQIQPQHEVDVSWPYVAHSELTAENWPYGRFISFEKYEKTMKVIDEVTVVGTRRYSNSTLFPQAIYYIISYGVSTLQSDVTEEYLQQLHEKDANVEGMVNPFLEEAVLRLSIKLLTILEEAAAVEWLIANWRALKI